MKTILRLFSVISLLAAGCSDRQTVVVSSSESSVVTTTNPPQEVLRSPKNSVVDATHDFVTTMDEKLHSMDDRIDALSAKAATYQGEAKLKADEAVADLREQRKTLGVKYDQLKQSSKEAWESTKEGVQEGWDKLESSFNRFKAKFN
jgi:hypothetical protein